LDRHVIEHPEYPCADSIAGQQNAPQALNRQNAGFFQWQVAYDGQDELLELFTRYPSRQRDGVEAARQLNVAIDRLPSFHDPKTNQRQFQFVAQVAQRVEDDALFAPGRRENVMDLVQDQHLDPEIAQKADCGPLELDDRGARVLRRAQDREDLCEEPAFVWSPRQFYDQQFDSWRARPIAGVQRVVILEFLYQHGLAHAAVAIDSERRHPCCPRMFEQGVEMSQYFYSFGIGDPALRADEIDALVDALSQNGAGVIRQMVGFSGHAAAPRVPTRLVCVSRCR